VNTRLAATPLRRATSVTFAPGANVSSTIRACHPETSAVAAPTCPKPRPASPDDLKARFKVTRFAKYTRQTRRRSSDAYGRANRFAKRTIWAAKLRPL
jgi:hypothetical protein